MHERKAANGPDYIPTKEIPKVVVSQGTLDAVLLEVRAMRSDTADKFVEVATRLDQLGTRIGEIEQRPPSTHGSLRARVETESKTNLAQDSAIATIMIDVASLKDTQEKQLSILGRLDAVRANPLARKVAYGLGVAILGWLAGTGKLSR